MPFISFRWLFKKWTKERHRILFLHQTNNIFVLEDMWKANTLWREFHRCTLKRECPFFQISTECRSMYFTQTSEYLNWSTSVRWTMRHCEEAKRCETSRPVFFYLPHFPRSCPIEWSNLFRNLVSHPASSCRCELDSRTSRCFPAWNRYSISCYNWKMPRSQH